MKTGADSQATPDGVPFRSRFQTRLTLLVLLVSIPAVLLTIQTNLKQRQTQKIRIKENTIALAKLAAANEENFVKNTRQLLATVSQATFLVQAKDPLIGRVHFFNLRTLSPDYVDFGLIESDGRLFCRAALTNEPANLSERSDFQRVFRTHRFSIGEYEPDGVSGKPALHFGYPIMDEHGELFRILYASLDLAVLSKVAADAHLPSGATLTLLDGSGHVLARYPDPENWTGKNMAEEPFVRRILRGEETGFELRGLDGVENLFAVAPIQEGREKRLFVSIGIPTQALFAEANRDLLKSLVVLAIVSALALLVAHFYAKRSLLHPLSVLVSAARRLATGDLNARVSINADKGEWSELGGAFDEMASRLEQRQKELAAANAEVSRMNAELEQRVKDRTFALEEANRELEAFTYSVSHDLRAPLRHIDGYAQLLRQNPDLKLGGEAKRHLDVITSAAKRMGRLIDDLLHFSRMNRGNLRHYEWEMGELVKEVLDEMALVDGDRRIEWHITPLPRVCADRPMLKQVMANLLSNAVKYTAPRERAEISVGYVERPEEWEFFVRDNGAGFDMRYVDKLFGVFQRLHNENEFEGTGIGLANVRRIINRHGGRTWAQGEVDKGATFYFTLPRRSAIP